MSSLLQFCMPILRVSLFLAAARGTAQQLCALGPLPNWQFERMCIVAKKNGKKKVEKKKVAKRKAIKKKIGKKTLRKPKGRFELPEFRNAPTNLKFISSFLKQAKLLTEISNLTVKELAQAREIALRDGQDLSPLALVIEVTADHHLYFHVVNCSYREVTLCAGMLEIDPIALEFHDMVQNVASKEFTFRLRGKATTLYPMGHSELPNGVSYKIDGLLDTGLLREGAIQINVEIISDGKKQTETAFVSCTPRNKQAL